MRPLPTAPVRLGRRRLALLAVALVSAIAGSASQIGSSATVRLAAEVNAHWRGAYDILVRPPGARLDLEDTNGLIEPNFVALAGHGGISEEQVAAIRAIHDVEIAAPIAWVGLTTTATTAPSIEITRFPSKPTLYSATLKVSTNDGVQSHLVFQDSLRILIAPDGGANGGPTVLSDVGDAIIGPLPGGGWVADLSDGHVVPQVQSPIIAVDPDAERALLGDRGAFLDPLVKLKNRDSLTVGTTDPHIVLRDYDQGADIAIMQQGGGKALSRPVFPVLVSARTYAPFQVTIDVSQIGHPLAGLPDASQPDTAALEKAATDAGPGSTAVGSNSANWAASIRAFRTNGIGVAWPGSQLAETSLPVEVHGATAFAALLAKRPNYTAVSGPAGDSTTPAFRISPLGPVLPGGPRSDVSTRNRVGTGPRKIVEGAEQSYRTLEEVQVPIAAGFAPQSPADQPFVLAPIGEYDLEALDLPHDPLDYVPYGAYDSPDTYLIAGADGRPVKPTSMSATLNPTGLLAVPPMGIVDIHAAELLRGSAPIDAVRVRVAGITDYGPAALAKVESVAASIIAMGLDVDIVAASSPQAVDVFVPEYNLAATPPADLGWIQQHWTTLGAAPRVELALGDTNLALLLLAIFSIGVVVGSVELVSSSTRAREGAVLAALGWRRSQIVRWQTEESVVAGLLVAALGLIAWLLGGRDPIALVVAVTAGLLFVVFGLAAALAVHLGTRAGDGAVAPAGRIRPAVLGLRTYAWRSVAARPWRSLTVVIGLALSAGVIAPAAALLTVLETRVGPTALGAALTERLQPYQLALLGLIALASLACAFLALRVDLQSRRGEFHVLEATGWRPRQIGRMMTWSRFFISIPTVLLAGLFAGLLSHPIAGSDVSAPVISALGGIVALVITLASGRLAEVRATGR